MLSRVKYQSRMVDLAEFSTSHVWSEIRTQKDHEYPPEGKEHLKSQTLKTSLRVEYHPVLYSQESSSCISVPLNNEVYMWRLELLCFININLMD